MPSIKRRSQNKWVIETYLYRHNQREGITARRRWKHRDGSIRDVSKYFSTYRYGSMSTAEWHARRWKNRNLI